MKQITNARPEISLRGSCLVEDNRQLKLFEDDEETEGLVSIGEIFRQLARNDAELQKFFEATGILKTKS
jgi:hypothetical protein